MRRIIAASFEQALKAWQQDNGDETLRLNYDLTPGSLVFDLGGFKGQWTRAIFSRYGCNVCVFEPVPQFFQQLVAEFQDRPKIKLFPCGLARETKTCRIGLDQDGSSIYKDNGTQEDIYLIKAADFLKLYGITQIDLMKVNIEGGEYDLLEHLVDSGLITLVRNLQVQFHQCSAIPNVQERMQAIQAQLSKTHELTYQYYPFVWENWQRRSEGAEM